jgi:hypothetical protein
VTYRIDVSRIESFLPMANVLFDDDYLERVLRKYYGNLH